MHWPDGAVSHNRPECMGSPAPLRLLATEHGAVGGCPHSAASIVDYSRGALDDLPAGPPPGCEGTASSSRSPGVSGCKLDGRSIPVVLCAVGHGRSHFGWLDLATGFTGFARLVGGIGTRSVRYRTFPGSEAPGFAGLRGATC